MYGDLYLTHSLSTEMTKSKDVSTNMKDTFYFFVLNVASSFMLSAAHNVLYFVLDIRTPVIHFLHSFYAFLFMLLLYFIGCIPKSTLPIQEFYVPVGAKFVETILSAIVHSQNRTGGLYLIRIFDFLFTFTLIALGSHFIPSRTKPKPEANLMIPLALAASLSWLEYGQLEYTTFSLFCSPLLAISRAISLLTLQRAYIRCHQGHIEQFCLYYSGLTACALFLPALISYSTSHVEVTASWESIDYWLMSLSFLFMSFNFYSEFWLSVSLNANSFATLEHTKYLGASIGQWIIQNMAHPNILALGGKIVTVASLFRIWTRM